MNSNEIQNDKINSTLIKVEALQKEYEVTLQQYQEAGQNYITELQPETSNPCSIYQNNSTNISQACFDKIWADQGCLVPSPGWAKNQTLDYLVKDSFQWASIDDKFHRKICYGDSTNYTKNTSPVYPNKIKFTALKGRTWWGQSGLSEGPITTQKECENMCVNSDKCSGATFNPVKKYCWTRTGDSSLTVGRDDDYALITQQKAAMSVMKQLNQKLLDLNQEINSELKIINPEVEQQYKEKNQKQLKLSLSYNQLLEQKVEIDKQLQEYYSIHQEE